MASHEAPIVKKKKKEQPKFTKMRFIFNSFFSLIIFILISNIVSNADQIITISSCHHFRNMSSTGTYTINQTIDCSGVVFQPISTFSGTLLGNNNTIQNVFINTSTARIGIFSCLSGATIQDLILLNFTSKSTSNLCVGSLSGKATNTTITNVHLKALPSSPNMICGSKHVGGLFAHFLHFLKNSAELKKKVLLEKLQEA